MDDKVLLVIIASLVAGISSKSIKPISDNSDLLKLVEHIDEQWSNSLIRILTKKYNVLKDSQFKLETKGLSQKEFHNRRIKRHGPNDFLADIPHNVYSHLTEQCQNVLNEIVHYVTEDRLTEYFHSHSALIMQLYSHMTPLDAHRLNALIMHQLGVESQTVHIHSDGHHIHSDHDDDDDDDNLHGDDHGHGRGHPQGPQ